MQKTPLDNLCSDGGVRIFAETDGVMSGLLDALGLAMPRWDPAWIVPQVRRRCEVERELAELCTARQSGESESLGGGFCVVPSASCPHAASHCATVLASDLDISGPCQECGRTGENW